ncbi:MAG: DMT family transporter [Anaerolineae bacterium]|jgi:drug/metabolite transporter (DMT)-like permease|nr:DMT family transporter [Anaerolineae bacterium]
MEASQQHIRARDVATLFAAPIFLGFAPLFGKLAIRAGIDPFSIAAIRTAIAVVILWSIYFIFFKKYIYIYPAGLLGCVVIGTINGIGSLFYYGGLGLLDASLAQLLNGMYLVFAVLISRFGGERVNRRTMIRVGLALIGIMLITGFGSKSISWLGVGFMLANALMFAGTLVLSQYVLYEMPAPTVTLYILTTMGLVVMMVWLAVGDPIPAPVLEQAIPPIIALGLTTATARLFLFAGVKILGGMQTAVLAITEIAVAIVLAIIFLGDRFNTIQTLGVIILFSGLLLIRSKDLRGHGFNPNALVVANMSSVQFQRIAFHRAFGTKETDNEAGIMAQITTQELVAIQRMMGAESGGIDPFPIRKGNQLNASMLPTQAEIQAEYRKILEAQEILIPPELQWDDDSEEIIPLDKDEDKHD